MVRYALAARGESQESVARVLGIAQSGVNERMQGRVMWRVDELDKLVEHFELTIGDLVDPPVQLLKLIRQQRNGVSVTRQYPSAKPGLILIGRAA